MDLRPEQAPQSCQDSLDSPDTLGLTKSDCQIKFRLLHITLDACREFERQIRPSVPRARGTGTVLDMFRSNSILGGLAPWRSLPLSALSLLRNRRLRRDLHCVTLLHLDGHVDPYALASAQSTSDPNVRPVVVAEIDRDVFRPSVDDGAHHRFPVANDDGLVGNLGRLRLLDVQLDVRERPRLHPEGAIVEIDFDLHRVGALIERARREAHFGRHPPIGQLVLPDDRRIAHMDEGRHVLADINEDAQRIHVHHVNEG